jgi:hypothetical protein
MHTLGLRHSNARTTNGTFLEYADGTCQMGFSGNSNRRGINGAQLLLMDLFINDVLHDSNLAEHNYSTTLDPAGLLLRLHELYTDDYSHPLLPKVVKVLALFGDARIFTLSYRSCSNGGVDRMMNVTFTAAYNKLSSTRYCGLALHEIKNNVVVR